MDPLRWELTWQLAGALGVVDGFQVIEPEPAGRRDGVWAAVVQDPAL